MNCEILEVDKR